MILESDVTDGGSLRFSFRLVPLLSGRQVSTCRIKGGDSLPIEINKNPLTRQGNHQGLPFAGCLRRKGGRRRQRVNGPGSVEWVASIGDLHFITAMHPEPGALFPLS